MKKHYKIIIPALLILSVAGYFFWQKSHTVEKTIEPAASTVQKSPDTLHFDVNAPQLSYVKIATVEAYPEPLVEPLNARVAYDDNRTAKIFSPISGRVVKILAEVNKQVKKGEGILQLDSPDYAQAIADSRKATADLRLKQETLARAKLLFEAKGLARKDLEGAESDAHQAEAEDVRARERLKNLNGAITREYYMLAAPHAGVITERQVSAGSEVRPDATIPLFVITDPAHLWVMMDLPEQDIDKVKIGQLVTVNVDAYPKDTFSGKVTAIAGALDPVTRRMQVRCEVDNKEFKLKPEMYARVWPVANMQDGYPRIPNTSIVTVGLYSYVFVETSPGVLQRRKVVLGLQGHEDSFVREGLKAGERVVTIGALLLNAELAGGQ
jgi:cobalt-zinc-cadmium efflux system membrane fusion protein